MGLNKEQKAAVEYLDGPLLVLAGPGTGKTQLLSAKVAYILETVDTSPENILCLTFTDAGAQNMRERLQSMIGNAALNVNIYTYHAFGADILNYYKNYGESFDRKLDSPIDDTMRYKIISEIQQALPIMDILRSSETKDIIDTISSAKKARLTAADLRKIATQNIEDSRSIGLEISPFLLALKPREKFAIALENVYQPILEVLLKYSTAEDIVPGVERIANVLAKELNKSITEATAADKPSVTTLNAWKKKYCEVYVPDTKHPDQIAYRLKDNIANKKLASLAGIMQKYEEELTELGLYDFDDMIECAIQYLKNDDGFRMELSERFQYVLLDEFQDTNVSQFELIKLLTDYEKPAIMAVGDDDQAIFAFQGANASNLRDFQEHYEAKVITLLDNYRSTGEVLGLSRAIAEQIDDSFAKNYQINKTLRSMRDEWAGENKVQLKVSRHEFPGVEAEYYWVAKQIRQLIDDGADPTEIAIIAPKHRFIAPILAYLKAQNIDVTYEKRDNILQDEKILMIIGLAKFVQRLAHQEQPVECLFEILSYRFWQLPPEVVVRAVERKWGKDQTVLDYLEGDPELEIIARFLSYLATVVATVPLELWLDYLIGATEIKLNFDAGIGVGTGTSGSTRAYTSPLLKYFQDHSSEAELLEFYENLSTLRQKVLQHMQSVKSNETDWMPKLADFVATIEDFELANSQIMRTSIYRDSSRAIQVMTSHKSKGLEFQYVFLTSVDDAAWGKSKGNNNKLALPCNLLQIRHTGITDDEQLRLFFVAITRAKEQLIMTSSRQGADGGDIKRLRYLSESSRDEEEQKSPFLLPEMQRITLHQDELTTAEKIETLCLNWISNYQKLEPKAMELLRERMKDYRLNATDLTTFIDIIYAGPQTVYQRQVLRVPEASANFAICFGNILHSVFEQITNQGIDDMTAKAALQNEAKRAVLTETERQDLLEKGEHALEITLAEFHEILRHQNAKAEVNLSAEHLNLDGVPLTGKIDHLEIDPVAKTIEVYDFKTGKYYDKKWDSQPSLYKYQLQLGFYKLLLNLSPTYRNYRVTRGHILFVSPDHDDKVYDKIYDYNDLDDQQLKKLIKAVYHHLTSLDFVADEEMFIAADKGRTVKDVKAFIEQVIAKGSV